MLAGWVRETWVTPHRPSHRAVRLMLLRSKTMTTSRRWRNQGANSLRSTTSGRGDGDPFFLPAPPARSVLPAQTERCTEWS